MIDHWCNAEHFRRLYEDAMRALTGDPDAQRAVEGEVAKVVPWNPPSAPTAPVSGFTSLGRALTSRHVPGGPGENAAAHLAEMEREKQERSPERDRLSAELKAEIEQDKAEATG